MLISKTITHAGVPFTVTGEVNQRTPATRTDPAEGGCFEDYSILVGEYDLTDLLDSDAIDFILEVSNDEL
jgi:hypothetical protein